MSPNTAPRPVPEFDTLTSRRFEQVGWERAADAWHRHPEAISTQAIAAMLDSVGIMAGGANRARRMLDVASGPGYGAAEAARRGAEARGIDVAAAQVAIAGRNFPAAAFDEGDAEALPYPDSSFDAVVINFGLQYFARPERALGEAYRVLGPGGRAAFTVWAKPPLVVGFDLVERAIRSHGEADVPLALGAEPYLFAEPSEAVDAFRRAGFHAPRVTIVPQLWRVADAEAILDAVAGGTVRAGALLRAQPPEVLAAVLAALAEEAEHYRHGEELVLPMPAVLACATKIAAPE